MHLWSSAKDKENDRKRLRQQAEVLEDMEDVLNEPEPSSQPSTVTIVSEIEVKIDLSEEQKLYACSAFTAALIQDCSETNDWTKSLLERLYDYFSLDETLRRKLRKLRVPPDKIKDNLYSDEVSRQMLLYLLGFALGYRRGYDARARTALLVVTTSWNLPHEALVKCENDLSTSLTTVQSLVTEGSSSSTSSSSSSCEDVALCMICSDSEACVLLMECAHLSVCEVCVVGLAICPQCLQSVSHTVRVFKC
mmetsp:Transcript_1058/g.1630  ORF Transcript_1058/g.1630 Transcript_1058/m.1630 type:complete len:250 (-) Transcript_1058:39-788(-)